MGWFNEYCLYCTLKPGFLSTEYYCAVTGKDLDKKSDLFKYGCDGGCTGFKYCPYHKEKK